MTGRPRTRFRPGRQAACIRIVPVAFDLMRILRTERKVAIDLASMRITELRSCQGGPISAAAQMVRQLLQALSVPSVEPALIDRDRRPNRSQRRVASRSWHAGTRSD
jgi:hypothetical protein